MFANAPSSSETKCYFSKDVISKLSSEVIKCLTSNLSEVLSIEDQCDILQNLNEDVLRDIFLSLPYAVISTHLDIIWPNVSKLSCVPKSEISPERSDPMFPVTSELPDPLNKTTLFETNPLISDTSHCTTKPGLINTKHCQNSESKNFNQSHIRQTCTKCEKTFSNKSSLKRHIVSKHGEHLGYQSSYCSKQFSYACNLKKHMKVHQHSPARQSFVFENKQEISLTIGKYR